MAKYKVKHTSIMHNGKMYKEGSFVEMSEDYAKKLADFLDLISDIKKTETTKTNVKGNSTKSNKQKDETKVKTTPEGSEGGKTDGK